MQWNLSKKFNALIWSMILKLYVYTHTNWPLKLHHTHGWFLSSFIRLKSFTASLKFIKLLLLVTIRFWVFGEIIQWASPQIFETEECGTSHEKGVIPYSQWSMLWLNHTCTCLEWSQPQGDHSRFRAKGSNWSRRNGGIKSWSWFKVIRVWNINSVSLRLMLTPTEQIRPSTSYAKNTHQKMLSLKQTKKN